MKTALTAALALSLLTAGCSSTGGSDPSSRVMPTRVFGAESVPVREASSTLGRPDVLPIDDLGVRKGAEKLYRRKFTPKELGKYGQRWAPFRSAAAWHLWRFVDTQTPDASKV